MFMEMLPKAKAALARSLSRSLTPTSSTDGERGKERGRAFINGSNVFPLISGERLR